MVQVLNISKFVLCMLVAIIPVIPQNIKACLHGCNILGQHHPTLLGTTCCLRLNTTLGYVGQCWIVLDDVG